MRGFLLQRVVFCLAGLALGGLATAAEVQAITVTPSGSGARAVIALDGKADYTLFRLKAPERIVLDLNDSDFVADLGLPASATGPVQRIRTGHHGKHAVRIVFDLASAASPRSFLRANADGKSYQLVLELGATTTASTPTVVSAPASTRKVVVAIDAGHGGVDPGAHGPRGTLEKNVTLSVARDLAKAINAEPGMQAVLTRSSDSFIPLKRRYQIARQHNADLFISIHADAFRDRDARGSSVWVLSPRGKTSEAARWLADGENRADLVGGVSLDDKDDTLAAVLLDLSQGATMQISSAVARNVLQALAKLGPTHRGHVEHANFVVLRSPDVPSILVETAFISNPTEEKQLASPAHRKRLAGAILDGVRDYFDAAPPPGTWFAARATQRGEKHIVARGETLSAIAQQYGVSTARLRQANSLSDADDLRAGAVLMIPTG
ncbi:MAG TPA: N-acetylmuramoyl-L-alanine amidase [Rhodanobacteraceae bacterium]|nr:N-acetylmuramoyl-L-alanine amidase [Rhodanobacteraceae bacterium]